jgi:hypothetical protein
MFKLYFLTSVASVTLNYQLIENSLEKKLKIKTKNNIKKLVL